MNDDLISRFDAIAELDHVYGRLGNIDMSGSELSDELEDIVLGLPSVQPKTGRWKHVEIEINKSDTGYFMLPRCECSVCDIYVEQESNYCPNCGADMRSKAREYLEYGELITKGIAQGLRGDSDE